MKKSVKIIIWSLLAVSAVVFAVFYALAPMPVTITPLVYEDVRVSFTEQGTYTYEKTYTVYPLVSGEVLDVPVSKGDTVQKGDTLATISARDYEYQSEKLESAIKGYQAQIAGLREQEQKEKDSLAGERDSVAGQIASVEAQISGREKSEISLERQMSFQEDVISHNRQLVRDARDQLKLAQEIDDEAAIADARFVLSQAQQAYSSSQMLLEQLEDGRVDEGYYEGQLESLQAQMNAIDARLGKSYTTAMASYYASLIEEAQTSIEEMREKQGKATATAPVSGVITRLDVRDINIISQQSPVSVIGSNACIEVFVSTRELDGIKTGDQVDIKQFKRTGNEIGTGRITLIDSIAESRQSALGVEESKVRVLVKPDGADIVIGQQVDVIFTVYRQPEALTVPKTAVFSHDGQDTVWVVRDGAAYRQTIEKGMETRNAYIINAGLDSGGSVITDANTQGLSDGKRVTGSQ
jgi:multidrug efflux pump subunit AcrA (membrane-fusion protein)